MKIGIETSCLDHTLRGVGMYTQVLLAILKGSETYFFTRYFPNLPFVGSLESLFKIYRGVDLVHFPEPKVLYGIRPKLPFVLTIHDVMPLKFPKFFPKKHSIMMRNFLPRYLKDASQIICVSETTRHDLCTFFPFVDPIVIPCGIMPRKRNPERERKPYFLYIGSFEKRKNLGRIISAFETTKIRGLCYELIIVGKGEGSNHLPKSLPPGVRALGYVSEAKKQNLLEHATALVWPSLYEGFGIPLLEAMASGTPVITSDRGACPETVADAGMIIDPEDPMAIADAMEQIATNKQLRQTLKEKGLKRAEAFSLPLLRDQLLSVYQTVRCSDIHAM